MRIGANFHSRAPAFSMGPLNRGIPHPSMPPRFRPAQPSLRLVFSCVRPDTLATATPMEYHKRSKGEGRSGSIRLRRGPGRSGSIRLRRTTYGPGAALASWAQEEVQGRCRGLLGFGHASAMQGTARAKAGTPE